MYPILFDPARIRAILVGRGDAALRRLRGLRSAGVTEITVFAPVEDERLVAEAGSRFIHRLPNGDELEEATIILVAGLDDAVAEVIAEAARALSIPVNVEDRLQWCDFHLPATLRRGDLLLTASTGGRSPGLARRLREHLGDAFGPEWEGRLDELADARDRWRTEGKDPADVYRLTQEWIDREGWFS